MTAATIPQSLRRAPGSKRHPHLDYQLMLVLAAMLAFGLVMVTSASMTNAAQDMGRPMFYMIRQAMFIGIGIVFAIGILKIPVEIWEQLRFYLLLTAVILLALVLAPGVGREVNGSTRWIPFGFFNLQVSEPAKLLLILYMAGYLSGHSDEVRQRLRGFMKPMAVMAVAVILLLAEPDLGAAVVIVATAVVMMFLAGMRWLQFTSLVAVLVSALTLLSVFTPYRLRRLTSFIDPWADPYKDGYQLINSLISFGRGEWLGVGLGSGIQKLDYLPEAHTDFIFSVVGEELGLAAVLITLAVYGFIVLRAFAIGREADRLERRFAAFAAYGIGSWVAIQSFINMGVVMGVLPTKGLTLPLLSYGGSSLVVSCITFAILLRIDFENRADGTLLTRSVWRAVSGEAPRHG